MKTKLLVLDEFTNGHEAAIMFIKNHNDLLSDCEMVFCGSHEEIFNRLVEGSSYAVVPVNNSLIGEITSVTKILNNLLEQGHELKL